MTVDKDTTASPLRVSKPGLGEITWLWMISPLHQKWPIQLMRSTVVPALKLEQYLIFYDNEAPVAYISWAWLNEEAEAQYISAPHSLSIGDWKSGDRLWFIDIVAPCGHMWAITEYLKNGPFQDDVGRFLRVKEGLSVAKISSLHGKNRKSKEDMHCPRINVDLIEKLSWRQAGR